MYVFRKYIYIYSNICIRNIFLIYFPWTQLKSPFTCPWYSHSTFELYQHFSIWFCIFFLRIATMQGKFMRVQVYLFLKYLLMLLSMFVNRGMSKDFTKKHGLEKLKVSNIFFPVSLCLDILSYHIWDWKCFLRDWGYSNNLELLEMRKWVLLQCYYISQANRNKYLALCILINFCWSGWSLSC